MAIFAHFRVLRGSLAKIWGGEGIAPLPPPGSATYASTPVAWFEVCNLVNLEVWL